MQNVCLDKQEDQVRRTDKGQQYVTVQYHLYEASPTAIVQRLR